MNDDEEKGGMPPLDTPDQRRAAWHWLLGGAGGMLAPEIDRAFDEAEAMAAPVLARPPEPQTPEEAERKAELDRKFADLGPADPRKGRAL